MPSTRLAFALVAAGLLAGCTTSVPGWAVGSAPRSAPYAPRALDRALPTDQELSAALGIAPTGLLGQLVEGGADTLLQGVDRSQATPGECVSPTYRLEHTVYAASPVRSVASQSWAGGGVDGPSLTGFFGVVQLATADDAAAFFATAAETWRHCDGRTLVLDQAQSGTHEQSRISDVVVDRRVVSAVVMHDTGSADGLTIQRALGVAADCIVDVELTDVADAGTGSARGAVDVADLMLKKLAG
jgi:PknH-like extracellular domain